MNIMKYLQIIVMNVKKIYAYHVRIIILIMKKDFIKI